MIQAVAGSSARLKAGWTDLSPDSLVFGTGTGRPQSQSNVRNRVMSDAVALANERRLAAGLSELPDGLTPQSLRRTYISLMLAIGDEVPYVMDQVGHTDPKVTLGIYAKVMFRKDGERDRLSVLVRGESTSGPPLAALLERPG